MENLLISFLIIIIICLIYKNYKYQKLIINNEKIYNINIEYYDKLLYNINKEIIIYKKIIKDQDISIEQKNKIIEVYKNNN